MATCQTYQMSIKIEHRNLEIWKTCNDFSVQVRNLILPLSLKVLRHREGERGTIFLLWLFHSPPSRVAPPRTCELAKANRLLPRQVSTLLTFFKFPKSSTRFRCVTSFTLASPRFPSGAIVTSLSDMSALPACAWTPVLMLHLTKPCAELKGSQPN